jgi:hypothetical protein
MDIIIQMRKIQHVKNYPIGNIADCFWHLLQLITLWEENRQNWL